MTTFEFFKLQVDEAITKGYGTTKVCIINHPFMSYAWVKYAADWFFGGAWDYQFKDISDISEMKEKGYLKVCEYTDWKSRKLGQTRKYALTNKGIRAFYKDKIDPDHKKGRV